MVLFALLAILSACGEKPERVEVTSPEPVRAVKEETMALLATRDHAAVERFVAVRAWNTQIGANMIAAAAQIAAREATPQTPQRRATSRAASPQDDAPWPWDELAECETGGNWQDGGDYGGGLGIYVGAWKDYGGREFAERAQYATKAEQIIVGTRISQDGWGGWGCAETVGLK